MDKRRRKQPKTATTSNDSQEVSSIEWEFINMTEQEEDLIYRMYRLVGDRSLLTVVHKLNGLDFSWDAYEVGSDSRPNPRSETGGNREVLDNETWRGVCRKEKRA